MKTAEIDVAGDCLVLSGVFADAGLTIKGSRESRGDVVRLVVEGDALPDYCAEGRYLLKPLFTMERYGTQSITRLARFEIVEKIVRLAA